MKDKRYTCANCKASYSKIWSIKRHLKKCPKRKIINESGTVLLQEMQQ